MRRYRKLGSSGSSLVEVLVAVTIVALALTAVISAFVTSARNQRASAQYQEATKYAQEGLEWMRKYRDYWGWKNFHDDFATKTSDAGFVICLSQLPSIEGGKTSLVQSPPAVFSPSMGQTCATKITGTTLFTRSLELKTFEDDEIKGEVLVQWIDNNKTFSVAQQVMLKEWQ